MYIPVVAIVGRPNVGKSSLLNRFARRRIAIVDSTPGVTRDRVSALVEHKGRLFELMDTGGLGAPGDDDFAAEVASQIEVALAKADVIIFLVDAREGLHPLDKDVARRLRLLSKPVLLAANKAERPSAALEAAEFNSLGFGEPLLISALQGSGADELLNRLKKLLPKAPPRKVLPEPILKFAIVGKRNVGKSTLVNFLAREERVIVSSSPGTTRDSVDVRYERDGKAYLAIDTPGVRRKKSVQNSVEFYSLARTERAVRRAQVVLFLIDALKEISRVDKQIASYITQQYKPSIIVVNKWDEVPIEKTPEDYRKYIDAVLPGMAFCPISFISALKGWHIWETLETAEELRRQSRMRLSTPSFNNLLEAIRKERPARPKKGKTPKIYYGAQTGIEPPTFVLFVNSRELFTASYRRYLENFIRKNSEISEVPLRIYFREAEPNRRTVISERKKDRV